MCIDLNLCAVKSKRDWVFAVVAVQINQFLHLHWYILYKPTIHMGRESRRGQCKILCQEQRILLLLFNWIQIA